MDTNLQGRLQNLSLPRKNGLIPLFEAVVNSIHAIEERFIVPEEIARNGRIDIYIIRENINNTLDMFEKKGDTSSGRKPERPIVSFKIVDNGVGFNFTNWMSFHRLDFTLKADKGCRGIGRLTWLKAFNDVEVQSIFIENSICKTRNFTFSREDEISGGVAEDGLPVAEPGSRVLLRNFNKSYAAAVEKTSDGIALRLLEHTLWYFVRKKGVPGIIIHDDSVDGQIRLNDLFEKIC